MDEEELLMKIINKTKNNELNWIKNKTKIGIIFNCRIDIDGNKKLILKLYLKNNLPESYLDIKINNGVSILRMNYNVFDNLYKLFSLLEYKIK
jgi:hypothetical protein